MIKTTFAALTVFLFLLLDHPAVADSFLLAASRHFAASATALSGSSCSSPMVAQPEAK